MSKKASLDHRRSLKRSLKRKSAAIERSNDEHDAVRSLAGISDTDSHTNAKTILLHMGTYFQIQDDYLDCYGDPDITGKIGTDIQDNKCSWLIVQALSLADKSQRLTLEENYGRENKEKVETVKDVFLELKLENLYRDFEEKSYTELLKLIESQSGNLPTQLFVNFANMIYKRKS